MTSKCNKGKKKQRKRKDIYDKYRQILGNPNLSQVEIEEMRKHLKLLAQTICEYIWRKRFY